MDCREVSIMFELHSKFTVDVTFASCHMPLIEATTKISQTSIRNRMQKAAGTLGLIMLPKAIYMSSLWSGEIRAMRHKSASSQPQVRSAGFCCPGARNIIPAGLDP
eukprot:6199510-Pleurochrysis_carterae.AAC.3